MNVVLIIPTGLGAAIGGHAGDANPVAKLIGSCCDALVTHPNVVNASDINEMPSNTWYVEGSILDRFLQGKIELQAPKMNRILAVANQITPDTRNAVEAARVTIGADIELVDLKTPLRMVASIDHGQSSGDVNGYGHLVQQVNQHDFDALAVHTPIDVSREVALHYYEHGGVNPWGGVEAKASRLIAQMINKPVAHAPVEVMSIEDQSSVFELASDPRMAPEIISTCYLHCILKGLHRAPRIGPGLGVRDIDFLVSPAGCYGPAHAACFDAGVPIIVVDENTTNGGAGIRHAIHVDTYLEAAGVIMCAQAGVMPLSVRVRKFCG